MENFEEIWRKVEESPQYEISNKNGWRNTSRNVQPKGRINHGYRKVNLGRTKERLYHVLVAKAFPEICGEWFEGASVHHINFNKIDNRPENLIVLTSSEHAKLHYKTQPDSFKKPSETRNKSISKALKNKPRPDKWISVIQLTLNGETVRIWDNLSLINKELGYSAGNICMCCKGQLKTAYGYKWQYAVTN